MRNGANREAVTRALADTEESIAEHAAHLEARVAAECQRIREEWDQHARELEELARFAAQAGPSGARVRRMLRGVRAAVSADDHGEGR